jgi:hypothetical protein
MIVAIRVSTTDQSCDMELHALREYVASDAPVRGIRREGARHYSGTRMRWRAGSESPGNGPRTPRRVFPRVEALRLRKEGNSWPPLSTSSESLSKPGGGNGANTTL